jgi:hypothetical protein
MKKIGPSIGVKKFEEGSVILYDMGEWNLITEKNKSLLLSEFEQNFLDKPIKTFSQVQVKEISDNLMGMYYFMVQYIPSPELKIAYQIAHDYCSNNEFNGLYCGFYEITNIKITYKGAASLFMGR